MCSTKGSKENKQQIRQVFEQILKIFCDCSLFYILLSILSFIFNLIQLLLCKQHFFLFFLVDKNASHEYEINGDFRILQIAFCRFLSTKKELPVNINSDEKSFYFGIQ